MLSRDKVDPLLVVSQMLGLFDMSLERLATVTGYSTHCLLIYACVLPLFRRENPYVRKLLLSTWNLSG